MCIRDRGRVGLRRRPEASPPRSATALDQAPTVTPEEPHPSELQSPSPVVGARPGRRGRRGRCFLYWRWATPTSDQCRHCGDREHSCTKFRLHDLSPSGHPWIATQQRLEVASHVLAVCRYLAWHARRLGRTRPRISCTQYFPSVA